MLKTDARTMGYYVGGFRVEVKTLYSVIGQHGGKRIVTQVSEYARASI